MDSRSFKIGDGIIASLGASLGACLAIGLSGLFVARMAEKAERERKPEAAHCSFKSKSTVAE